MRSRGGGVIGGAVTTETAYGQASNAGASTTAAASDHTHGTPGHDDHTLLSDIGGNDHTTIDAHLADYTFDTHMGFSYIADIHYTYSDHAHVLDTMHFNSGSGVDPGAAGTGVLRGLKFDCDKAPTYKWIGGNPWTTDMYPSVQFWWECEGFTNSTAVHFFAFSDVDALTNSFGFKWSVSGGGTCTMQGFVNVGGVQTTANLATVSANTPYFLNGEVAGGSWYAYCNGSGGLVGSCPSGKVYFVAWAAENIGDSNAWILRYPSFRVVISDALL